MAVCDKLRGVTEYNLRDKNYGCHRYTFGVRSMSLELNSSDRIGSDEIEIRFLGDNEHGRQEK